MRFKCWHRHGNFAGFFFFFRLKTNTWPLLLDVLLIQHWGQIAECHCNDVPFSIFFSSSYFSSLLFFNSLWAKAELHTYALPVSGMWQKLYRSSIKMENKSWSCMTKDYLTGASSQTTNKYFRGYCVRNQDLALLTDLIHQFPRIEKPDHKRVYLEVSFNSIFRGKWHLTEHHWSVALLFFINTSSSCPLEVWKHFAAFCAEDNVPIVDKWHSNKPWHPVLKQPSIPTVNWEVTRMPVIYLGPSMCAPGK